LPAATGKFYALDAKSGALKWKFATGGERRFEAKDCTAAALHPDYRGPLRRILSSPVVAGGAVFFGSGDGHLYALDAASGELRWKFKTGDVVHASPAYAAGTLYFGSWDSYFYAVDAVTGKEKWRFHGGEDALIHNQVGFQSSPPWWTEWSTPAAAIPRICARCRHGKGEVARQQSGKLGQQFTRGGERQSLFRHVGFQPLPGSRRRYR